MTERGRPRDLRALILLLLAAAIWGFAFVAQRSGMAHVGPFLFNGVRFLLGALALVPFMLRRTAGRASRSTVAGLIGAGLVLTVAANLQQVGLVTTTAGKAGFLTGLYVVFVPLIGLVLRQPLRRTTAAAVPLAAGGLYLLAVKEGFAISSGDGWILLGAAAWAVHVQIIDRLVRRADAVTIAVTQFSICGAISLAASFAFEEPTIAGLAAVRGEILYAGVLSVGVAYTLQIVGQRRVAPAQAGIVLSLEAVFAALGGWLILGERLSARSMVGCGLMLAAMLLAHVGRESSSIVLRRRNGGARLRARRVR